MEQEESKKFLSNCLLGNEVYDLFLGKPNKLALSSIGDRRRYVNNIDSVPWEKQN